MLRIASGLFVLTVATIVAAWAWLGAAVPMPATPFGPDGKVYCLSYAPFHGDQTPLDLPTHIDARQIEEDLIRLKPSTGCVRTYSNDFGIDQVPAIAQRLGLQVIQGLWLSSDADRNQAQIRTAVALAKTYPDTIRAIVVGNEVLLRGELSSAQLADAIRTVKAQVKIPVTYADVWEFWLRNRDLASLVDFVTVHILPYWEDFPIPAAQAAAHVDAIHRKVAEAFPGKEVLIGETGWPSQGRMREGALPSPANQARMLHDVLALAQRQHYRVNLIEAFDQPWKRRLEGTVGGYWGLYDDATRQPKFTWGEPVSNHPHWRVQAAGGGLMALLIFLLVVYGGRGRAGDDRLSGLALAGVTASAIACGICSGWALESAWVESFELGGWVRSIALLLAALAAVVVGTLALMRSLCFPAFAAVLGRAEYRPRDGLQLGLGLLLVVAVILVLQSALGLAFDPRYRDFPFAVTTVLAAPLLAVSLLTPRSAGPRGVAETTAAGALTLCAVYIGCNEGFANWQSLWFCALLLVFAVILARVRVAPG